MKLTSKIFLRGRSKILSMEDSEIVTVTLGHAHTKSMLFAGTAGAGTAEVLFPQKIFEN